MRQKRRKNKKVLIDNYYGTTGFISFFFPINGFVRKREKGKEKKSEREKERKRIRVKEKKK